MAAFQKRALAKLGQCSREDWLALLDFANSRFFIKKSERSISKPAYPNAELPIKWNVPRQGQHHSNENPQDAAIKAEKSRD